jgi:hypothetical protein
MKHSSSIAVLTLALAATPAITSASGEEPPYPVIQRKKNGGYRVSKASIPNLVGDGRFETEHFRVLWKKEEETLSLQKIQEIIQAQNQGSEPNPRTPTRTEEDLIFLASNTLYHAEKARSFFIERLGSKDVAKMEKVNIRLDISNLFNEEAQFAHDNRSPQFNNALSIPAGQTTLPGLPQKQWGRELWFRPIQKIPAAEILRKLPEDPINPTLRKARSVLYPMMLDITVRDFLYATFQNRMSKDYAIDGLTRQGGTLLLMEGSFQVLRVLNRILTPNVFFEDTAMVPEIIYHEYAHLALSDQIEPNVSTPVNEGMADFFAASIADSPKLGKKIKAYSKGIGKNGKKRQIFDIEKEALGKAQSDFVLSILWGLRDVLGKDAATNVVFESRKHLSTFDSDIRKGLVRALLLACESRCESPLRDRMLIHQFLQERGI